MESNGGPAPRLEAPPTGLLLYLLQPPGENGPPLTCAWEELIGRQMGGALSGPAPVPRLPRPRSLPSEASLLGESWGYAGALRSDF